MSARASLASGDYVAVMFGLQTTSVSAALIWRQRINP